MRKRASVPSEQKTGSNLGKQVEERFGVLPNFFQLSPETPEITEKLWGFAKAAYLDNPLPSLFKDRLFVLLSRFCAVRYCISRHVGFLVGLGRPSGDACADTHTVKEVVSLLRRPFPCGRELELRLLFCASCRAPIDELPSVDSPIEDALFALAGHVFLQTSDAPVCLAALKRLLGAVRLQYVLLFLAFVRTAHYWTRVHPSLALEDDVKQLLSGNEELADCILNDPEVLADTISQSLMDELPELRQRADKALGLLAAIIDSSDDAIVSKTLGGVITSWNRSAERLFGYTAQEAIGQHISFIIPEDRLHEEVRILDRIGKGEKIEHFDTVRVRKDGTSVDISLCVSPVRDPSGQIVGASKIARDITERRRAEQALQESEERYRALADALDTQVQVRTRELKRRNEEITRRADQVRDLSVQLLQSQDEERRRIARELHDSVGQTLAALNMSLAKVEEGETQEAGKAKAIKDAEELVQHLTQEIRTMSYLLHPPLLDEVGLSSALRWYIEGLRQRSGLDIRMQIPERLERLPREMELVIFRLVQECLTNVHRHSASKVAYIRLHTTGDKIFVEVEDKGTGMSPERLREVQSEGAGIGLRGMRERVRQFNGDLVIESNRGGTKVLANLSRATPASAQSMSGEHNVA